MRTQRITRGTDMATDRGNNLRAFTSFASEKLSHGEAMLTLDEALCLWDHENQSEEEREATLQAIRNGLEDVEAGRVRPARDVIAELRRKFNLSDLS